MSDHYEIRIGDLEESLENLEKDYKYLQHKADQQAKKNMELILKQAKFIQEIDKLTAKNAQLEAVLEFHHRHKKAGRTYNENRPA